MTAGREIIATDHGVTVTGMNVKGEFDDGTIDAWELKASRRALANLRELLLGQAMLDLLAPQLDEADDLHRQYLAESNGEFTPCNVVLRIKGLHLGELIDPGGMTAAVAGAGGTPEQKKAFQIGKLFPQHPEHYAVPEGYTGVVETMGGIPTRSQVKPADPEQVPDFVKNLVDDSYPVRVFGYGELDDGTFHTWALQQFKDTEDGLEANLRIFYPAACPPEYVDEHAEHFAVEYRNSVRLAAAALGR